MICIVNQHFRINRILLLAIGLWPYQRSLLVRYQQILFIGILGSHIVFQLTIFITSESKLDLVIKILSVMLTVMTFMIKYNSFLINSQTLTALITTKCTPEFIIKVLSFAMICSTFVIKYNSFCINAHNVKCLFEQLQNICNKLKDENEIAIIKKYGENAKYFTAAIMSLAMCGAFILILLPFWPHVLHTVLHKNESEPRQKMQIVTEYFVDQEKYFYLILLHTNVVICIGVTTFIGTGTTLLGYVIYACGLFRIASYRIEQVMTIKVLENVHLENQTMIYKEIIDAIEIHRKAIRFSEFLSTTFEGTYFLIGIIFVLSLSLNIFGIFRNTSLGNMEGCLFHLLNVSVSLTYMFLTNYAGQELTNHNNHVYSTAYNSRWYIAPLHAQKLILFMLQRGSKTVNLNIGGLVVASLECFTTLTKTSMSYFTFLYSMQ